MRQINTAGFDLIKSFESCRLCAYKPTPNDVWTIGYGHTEGVSEGDVCTQGQADEWLMQDIGWAETAVENLVTVDLTDNQFSALVSITFNIGKTAFRNSTLLKELDGGDYPDAASQFLVWDKQRGVDIPGLDARREAEMNLFNSEDG